MLVAVLDRGHPLDQALAQDPILTGLDARDRGLAHVMLRTVLRRRRQLDALIDGAMERPLAKSAARTRHILGLGLAQMVFLGTPAHAAVALSVALAAEHKASRPFKGLINAVLRRLAREAPARIDAQAQEAGRLNTPDWLYAQWRQDFGADRAARIADAHLAEPPLDLTIKDRGAAAAWADRLGGTLVPTGSVRLTRPGPVPELAGFSDGAWWVQDAAAALPAMLLGDVAGKTVLDMCAAPGGKTAQLASLGAVVTALDSDADRLARVSENLARLSLTATVMEADATAYRPDQPFDAVLLDAPCGATGTIRRHPDLPWRRRHGDDGRLRVVQARLLDAALDLVRPGGLVVYATCSLDMREGEDQIAALLDRRRDVARQPVTDQDVPGLSDAVTETGELRLLPCHWAVQGGMDGFFISRLRRG